MRFPAASPKPTKGGAIYNAGTLNVAGSTFTYNTAGYDLYLRQNGDGGAIYNAGKLNITDSTLSDNEATGGSGGAIFNSGALTVTACTLSGNSAKWGGAIYSAYRSTAAITSCTLTSNKADYGGAIWNWGTMTLTGTASDLTTVTNNTATESGGGIYNEKGGKLTISFSTVRDNTASLGADLYNAGWVKISKDSSVGVIAP